ncbi:MAG: hypothetical protein A2X77_06155 [Gammaproteobacteria bacterium GWE2_42_36]|nr:MAG: hypothetical protein A2X77_06155 [Gammaproteobacteria bacterium GWE2_42_36]HCU05023.1 hypothetical protein [Coxiellaceae bacterium]
MFNPDKYRTWKSETAQKWLEQLEKLRTMLLQQRRIINDGESSEASSQRQRTRQSPQGYRTLEASSPKSEGCLPDDGCDDGLSSSSDTESRLSCDF